MKNRTKNVAKGTSVLWIAVGLGMGLAVACGGSSQGSEPSKTAADPASSAAAAPAGSAAAPAGGAAAAKDGPGPDQIRAVLKDHSRELKACYDREKDRGMAYRGDTKFQVKIEANGKVSDVKGVDVAPQAEFLSACVSDLMKGWTFPASSKPSNVTIPVVW
jgi:outer membrane biosynthesis protein TonB